MRFPRHHFSTVVLCNSFAVPAGVLARHVADIYLGDSLAAARGAGVTQAAHPTVPSTPTGRRDTPSSADDFVRYTGVYFSDVAMVLRRIVVDSGRLRYVRSPGNANDLVPTGTRTFAVAGTAFSAVFSKGADSLRMEGVGGPPVVFTRRVPAAGADPKVYAGTYISPELRTTWTFAASGATLLLHPERGDTVRFAPVFAEAFEGSGVVVQFQRDTRGRIIAADVSAGERARSIHFTRQMR
jgi:hypothetical protein